MEGRSAVDERSYVDGAISEGAFADGTFRCDGARIADRLGEHRLPIGVDSFERLIERSVFVDKSLLIADVLDSGAAVTLYCRPRRFGKTLGLSMLKSFIENPVDGVSRAPLFENLAIWDARSGRYRVFQGGYPVVFLSFNDVKKPSWQEAYKVIAQKISYEYQRHSYLLDSPALNRFERAQFARACTGEADYGEIATSLLALMRYLHKHHGAPVAVLVDEYDVPIVAGHAGGYYDEAVAFLKGLLTGAFKGSDDLAFGCLTGVQRIAKETIFTDLNNLTVSTALSTDSDERFGFTHADVEALARYLGHAEKVPEIRSWYDGYRFGDADIFNPWSVLNYFRSGCTPDVYWVNTSGNTVVGEAVASADARRLGQLFDLLKPGGSVTAPLDLGVVFPEVGGGADAVWSLLYLAGYLTTYDTQAPNNARVERRLRIPNREIAELFRGEVVDRFSHEAGGGERLRELQQALAEGDGRALAACIEAVLVDAASCRDLTSENSYHMLMLGLLFGIPGYEDPISNREGGRGYFDILLRALSCERPDIVLEFKYVGGAEKLSSDEGLQKALENRAVEALEQITAHDYSRHASQESNPGSRPEPLRYGIAFGGRHVAVATPASGRAGDKAKTFFT